MDAAGAYDRIGVGGLEGHSGAEGEQRGCQDLKIA
jgi:hypothetical protein